MHIKFKLTTVAVIAMFVSVLATPVSAQSWYTEFLDLNVSSVAGANTARGKPSGTPGSQAQVNKPDTSTRGSQDANTSSNDAADTNSNENAPTNLRRNAFSTLSEIKDLTTEERQERIEELKSAAKEARCEMISANVSRRIDYYQNSQSDHLNRYQGIVVGLTKSAGRLSELGYDTTDLESKISILQAMINEMNLSHNELIASLQSISTSQCSVEDSDPSGNGQLARSSVQVLRTKALEIKEYIRNEIIPTLQALREQQVEESPDVPEENEEDTTDNL